ncbi:MAG: isoleucyl-tRNA synthetase [Pedosphaera sp.]|nr:isoleucyl-tRNA synthetase [Pedosphaera sp.]
MDYKNTLNLPQTDFPMKADLVGREPQRLEKWQAMGLYEKIQSLRASAPKFVLHDGPPFANGDVHIGTGLNKTLKDIVVKYQSLRGKSAPYIPGWDCHGLPIEFKVTQEMRKAGDTNTDPASIRKACDAYARKYIDIQRAQFKRLGILGDWENPYLTLNKEYEADELRLFADIVEKGFVYRGKKPVYWSIPARTALAEAEVEYHDHVSQSIYVKFPVVGQPNTSVVIWTTTPWTLPANLAVAYNSTFNYSLVRVGEEKLIVSAMLLSTVAEKCGWKDHEVVGSVTAAELGAMQYQHPFANRTGKFFTGNDFVENSTGTGFVHIAPGHGLEDYNLGRQQGLPIYSPVDDDGCLAYTDDLPREQQMPAEMVGKSILEKHGKSDANEAVLHELRLRKVLLHQENYHHSYPYCWRSKTATIFRAMDQWFIKIDHEHFRAKALEAIHGVNWVPDWGKSRIEGAVKSRPDWCISRQRTWGVPIPAFYDEQGHPMLDAQIVRNVAALIEKHGSNIWFEKTATELWALVKPADWKGAAPTAKSNDTLDVWIDSGSSSRAVLMRRPELQHAKPGVEKWQADVYLEGSDQHRGWFQSSLLLSLAGNGATPYKTVLTHGFMVDADREKISKSKQGQGVYEKPQTSEAYIKKYGADVVRLWVASQDYRSDIVVSEERINKVSETYRGIRNTLRYQLSNLFDFDPAKHAVPDESLTGLDRWILSEFSRLEQEVMETYDKYEFHVAYQKISQFIAVELSAMYHDAVKDRLYTDAANSPRRRSTQTALHRMVGGLCRMLSPILVFTADEAWEFVPGKPVASVHMADWTATSLVRPEAEQTAWKHLFELRELALPELEKARQAKTIGKALDAKLSLAGASPILAGVKGHLESLRELLNVSQLEITATGEGSALTAMVTKADGQKCERCWHWETDVGSNPEHPTICARCVTAVKENLAR